MSGRGFGVAAGLDPEIATPLAARCAELGYGSIWSNDHPVADGLGTLAEFAKGTDELDLGVGAIALDRRSPTEINARIKQLGLDRNRLWLGVGAGFSEKPLTTMRDALPRLREQIPGVRLVLAAMGLKMCALAGSGYDGVLFNWMTPGYASSARAQVEAGAEAARRNPPPVFGYVRCSVGADAETRLAKDEGFYRDLHDGYVKHFGRLDHPPGTVGVAAEDPDDADPALARFDALDVTVVRGLAGAELNKLDRVATAAAPRD